MSELLRRAAGVYLSEPCARSFNEDLWLHLTHGYVFSTQEYLIMGRPVQRGAPYSLLVDPTVKFADPDCWWVHLAVGNQRLDSFIDLVPFPLRWVGWERKNVPRFYEFDHLKETIYAAR